MIQTTDKQAVITLLKRADFVPYNIIGTIENNTVDIYCDWDSQSVWVCNGNYHYAYGDPVVIRQRYDSLPNGAYTFCGMHNRVASVLYSDSYIEWFEPTERYVLAGQLPHYQSPYRIIDIPLCEASAIDARYEYQDETTLAMITKDIKRGPTAGLYIDEVLVSYAFVHDDNSLGYMYTLPQQRGKGLAYDVAYHLVKQMLKRQKTCFLEIKADNLPSQKLAAKLGFIKDQFTPWFGLVKGRPVNRNSQAIAKQWRNL